MSTHTVSIFSPDDITYATVDQDGTVRVFDDMSGFYTLLHALTEGEQKEIRAASAEYKTSIHGVHAEPFR